MDDRRAAYQKGIYVLVISLAKMRENANKYFRHITDTTYLQKGALSLGACSTPQVREYWLAP